MATAKTVAQLLEPSKSAVVVPFANKKPVQHVPNVDK